MYQIYTVDFYDDKRLKFVAKGESWGCYKTTRHQTPPNPSMIDVMVGSPSKKQMRERNMLQSFGDLFLVWLIIYYEFERV